jgi:hypothetical protein
MVLTIVLNSNGLLCVNHFDTQNTLIPSLLVEPFHLLIQVIKQLRIQNKSIIDGLLKIVYQNICVHGSRGLSNDVQERCGKTLLHLVL